MTLAWGSLLTAEERGRLLEVAAEIGCAPNDLSGCIYFESRWDPTAVNAQSGATGLIQFIPSTARSLDTTTDAIRAMTRIEQLDLIYRYFAPFKGRLRGLSDVYMAILWPRAVGKPEDWPLFTKDDADSRAYFQNKGLDVDADGVVTKAEATAKVRAALERGLLPENVADTETQPAAPIIEAGTPAVPATEPVATPRTEAPMGIGMILSLLPTILGAFSGKAQPQVAPILAQLGTIVPGAAPPAAGSKDEAIIKFATDVMGMVLGAAGVPAATATDAQKVQATAKVIADPALVAQVEDGTLKRLEALGPTFDRLIAIDKVTNEASVAGKDAAGERSRMDKWDMTKSLVWSSEGLIWFTMALLCAAVLVQIVMNDDHEPSGVLVGMIGPLLMMVYKNRSQPFDYRFDGTPSSNAATAINAEIAARK